MRALHSQAVQHGSYVFLIGSLIQAIESCEEFIFAIQTWPVDKIDPGLTATPYTDAERKAIAPGAHLCGRVATFGNLDRKS